MQLRAAEARCPARSFICRAEARSAARSLARLPLAAACAPRASTGPGEYTGLAGSWAVGDAGYIVCRLDMPSTDSTMPESDFGSTGSWLLAKKVLAPSR